MAVALGPRQSGGSSSRVGGLTADDLRERLRIPADVPIAQVEDLLSAASALVERYAAGAPTAIKNEATVRAAGWMRQAPAADVMPTDVGVIKLTWRPTESRNALRSSGAGGASRAMAPAARACGGLNALALG